MTILDTMKDFLSEHLFGSILALYFVVQILFRKRIEKRFDLEAEFRDEQNREIAEFDTKSWRKRKSEDPYQFKASFRWTDASLSPADSVEVFLDEDLVLKGVVSKAGRIFLGEDDVQKELTEANPGQICRIVRNDVEVMRQEMVLD